MRIILIGKMATGKSSIASALASKYNIEIKSFAKKVKELSYLLLSGKYIEDRMTILLDFLNDEYRSIVFNDAYHDTEWFLDKSFNVPVEDEKPRKLFQYIGNGMRELLGENIWVDLLKSSLKEDDSFIIDDCRYPNEAESFYLNKDTYIIKLFSDDKIREERLMKLYGKVDPEWFIHPSEVQVDNITTYNLLVDSGKLTIEECVNEIGKYINEQ